MGAPGLTSISSCPSPSVLYHYKAATQQKPRPSYNISTTVVLTVIICSRCHYVLMVDGLTSSWFLPRCQDAAHKAQRYDNSIDSSDIHTRTRMSWEAMPWLQSWARLSASGHPKKILTELWFPQCHPFPARRDSPSLPRHTVFMDV